MTVFFTSLPQCQCPGLASAGCSNLEIGRNRERGAYLEVSRRLGDWQLSAKHTLARRGAANFVANTVNNPLTRRYYQAARTSAPAERAGPDRLLAWNRGHWQVENGNHCRRDATFGEGVSRIRARHAPANNATLDNIALAVVFHRGLAE